MISEGAKKELSTTKKFFAAALVIVLILLIPLIALVGVVAGIVWLVQGAWLGLRVRLQWCPRGKYLLFVYSNSRIWKDYIESNILPKIGDRAVVMNWSERSQWDWKRPPLEVEVFRHWAGVRRYFLRGKRRWDGHEFNPIAITFIPWWRRRVFRFWQPFKDFKHGKEQPLKRLEGQLLELVGDCQAIRQPGPPKPLAGAD